MADKFWYVLVGPASCCFVLFFYDIAVYLFPSRSGKAPLPHLELLLVFLIFPIQMIGTALFYLKRRNIPSEAIGRHRKLGLALINLFGTLIVGLYFGFDPLHLIYFGGFISEFHIICQFYCHPPDLGVLDWAFQLLMQLVLYSVSGIKYGFIASIVVYAVLISERYRSYSCPCPSMRGRQDLAAAIFGFSTPTTYTWEISSNI